MCGIAGYILQVKRTTWKDSDAVFQNLMYFNRPRGVDAYGLMKAKHEKHTPWATLKEVGDPYGLLLGDDRFKNFSRWLGDNHFMVAHNRLSTRGDPKSAECAHPFVEEKGNGKGTILLVHNGTITHFKSNVDKDVGGGKTDSHVITKLIADGMPLDELEDSLWGAYALVWYDSEKSTLNFFRNTERTLGFVHTKDAIWFGSEIYMVATALERNNILVDKLDRLVSMEHRAYNIHTKKWTVETIKVKKPSGAGSSKPDSSLLLDKEGNEILVEGDDIPFEAANDILAKNPKSPPPFSNHSWKPNDPANGRTSVLPHPNQPVDDPDSYMAALQGPYKSIKDIRKDKYRSDIAKKERWVGITEHDGYQRGDNLIFSLRTLTLTDRGTQIILEGTLAKYLRHYDGKPCYQLCMPVEIEGMITGNLQELEGYKGMWKGKVAQIYRQKHGTSGHSFKFKIFLKDIEKDNPEFEDTFYDIQRGAVRRILEQEKQGKVLSILEGKKNVVVPSTPKIEILPPSKMVSQKPAFFHCDDCEQHYSGDFKREFIQKEGDEPSIKLEVCGSCFKSLKDHGARLATLFEIKRRRAAAGPHERSFIAADSPIDGRNLMQ